MRFKLLFFVLIPFLSVYSQSDSAWNVRPEINVSGFLDCFYAYDFNQPKTDYRQTFLYNHNRQNEFNINLALIKLNLNHQKYRGNLALHAGTYVQDNYASEKNGIKFINEASIGVSLNQKNNLWLDAGVFPSHIGFESAISIDNSTLTRSILAENSPYFLSGAKVTYSPSKKVDITVLILNGWQRIGKVSGNSLPSFGTQVLCKLGQKSSFNWSTFIGTDDPDSTRRMRYFNNFYFISQVNTKLSLTAGFDIGFQQKNKFSSTYETWFSPVLITKYQFSNRFSSSIRIEYYEDQKGIIIPNINYSDVTYGFNTLGFSLNLDYFFTKNLALRFEGRYLKSEDPIFRKYNSWSKDNICFISSLSIKF